MCIRVGEPSILGSRRIVNSSDHSLLVLFSPFQYRPSSSFNSPYWTTNSGAPVWNNNNSVTVGVRGTSHLVQYLRSISEYLPHSPFYSRTYSLGRLPARRKARQRKFIPNSDIISSSFPNLPLLTLTLFDSPPAV